MPTPAPIIATTQRNPQGILASIIARLVALNSTDPTLIALLAEYQASAGATLQ